MFGITPLPLGYLLQQYAEEHEHLMRLHPYSEEDWKLVNRSDLSSVSPSFLVLSPDNPNWELISRLWSLENRLQEDMLRVLAESPASAALAIQGYTPWGRGNAWVEAAQLESGTALERTIVPESFRKPTLPELPRKELRLNGLAGLCEAWCQWLDRHGFWELDAEVGQPALGDYWSVAVWCKYRGRCRRV